VAVAALALGALAAPAAAQIIATSIPKSISGGGEGRWAFHVMYSPYAKWKINTFEEDPRNFLATSGKPKSDFLGAAEVAFKAGDAVTVGVGGWYNKIGTNTSDYIFVGITDEGDDVTFAGPVDLDVTYTEGHANVFYKDLGVQFGIVHNSRTVRAITTDVVIVNGQSGSQADIDFANQLLAGIAGVKDTANDYDGYLIYKVGRTSGNDTNWSFSLGGGFYRYDLLKKTVPSAFATATVGIFKGLGVDASFWYVGKTKRSQLQQGLRDAGVDLDQNLSRWMVGVSYTLSR
jgi:hypothetical protein